MRDWYAVYCKPRSEAAAETNLCNQGYQVYFPRLLSHRRRAGKWIDSVEPLFPRYIFLKVRSAAQSLGPVRSTIGVMGLVRFGGQPAVLSEEVIEQLRRREDEAARMHSTREIFRAGDVVTFIEGPFSGLEAVFKKKSGEERVIVLLELLGKISSLNVAPGWLAPAV